MRAILALALILCYEPAISAQERYVPGEILAYFGDDNAEVFQTTDGRITCAYENIMSYLTGEAILEAREIYHGPNGVRNIYVLRFSADADILRIVNDLGLFPEINEVSPNYYGELLSEPNDFYYNSDWWVPDSLLYIHPDTVRCLDQWNLLRIQAIRAWDIQKGSPSVTVGILDTGVDYFHPDLTENIWVNPAEDLDGDGVVWDLDDLVDTLDAEGDPDTLINNLIGWDFVFGDNDPHPLQPGFPAWPHGTQMASAFAVTDNDAGGYQSIAGIAQRCKIVPLKVVHPLGGGDTWESCIAAINYAINAEFDVLNMSIGYWIVPAGLHAVIQRADSCGIVMVAAAGNDNAELPVYPASYPEVISAAAVDASDSKWIEEGVSSSGSNYGTEVDVCGIADSYPGRYMVHTSYEWTPLYDLPGSSIPHTFALSHGRTSYAAAQVSAVACLLRSMYPDSSPAFIKSEIMRGAIPVDTAAGNIAQPWQYLLGAGRINPYRSLTQWGFISQNTTWSNTVYVSADIKVDAGVTLTIEPGTTIYVAADDNQNIGTDLEKVAFNINGTFIANGTAENPITFRSLSENPAPGDWFGIFFSGENSTGSLSHCNIRDAKYGVVSNATIEMTDCEITNCRYAGIYLADDNDSLSVVNNESVIKHCTITENDYPDASGMRIWNCPLEVTVDSCTVNTNYRGIWVSNARPTISWSEIACNQEDGIWVTSYRYPQPYPYPTIRRCQIFLNGESGIRCEYNKAQVSYTKSYDNGSYGLLAYGVDAYPEIDHSKIIENGAAGVRAENEGKPVLGIVSLGKGQNNSLYGQPKNVYNATAVTVYAENCWWGTTRPDKKLFYGLVDYTPYLTSDPVPYLAPSAPTPPVFALAQNYPNPFGPASETTLIRYSLPPSLEKAELKIYDVSGRLVRTLVDGVREGDQYIATWDGRNDRGVRVAAGIYFYKLWMGEKAMTKKMVLLR